MRLPLTLIALVVAAFAAQPAGAQSYPNQVVRIVVPFSAGSITDGLARILGDKLTGIWKQQVIIENRPGLPGTTAVAKSPADGYTLMLTSNGHTIAGAINKNLQFDPVKDFAGITRVALVPLVGTVPASFPANTLPEFIDIAKQKPGQLNFSSAGVASTTFLCAEIMRQAAGINIVHIPYKGLPEATTAVIRNDAQIIFVTMPSAQELSAAGKLKPIAIDTSTRMPQLPNVPTVAETLPQFKYQSWFGVFAPAGTPTPIVRKVSADIGTVLQMPDVKEKMLTQGSVPAPTAPGEFDAINRADTERYGKILRDAGITPQ
jgi:tripartite-type tricarboxylate transporter receptor subunit TctC